MLLCVDFQPLYQSHFSYLLPRLEKRVNTARKNWEPVEFLFNDLEEENVCTEWLSDMGFLQGRYKITPKNYAWVTEWMDTLSDDHCVEGLRLLLEKGLHDSREFSQKDLLEIVRRIGEDPNGFPEENPRDWRIMQQNPIFLPPIKNISDWLEGLKSHETPIEVSGGGRDACLQEIVYLLQAAKVPFELNEAIIY